MVLEEKEQIAASADGQTTVLEQEGLDMLSLVSGWDFLRPIITLNDDPEDDSIKTLDKYLQEGEHALEIFLKEYPEIQSDTPFSSNKPVSSIPNSLIEALSAYEDADVTYNLSTKKDRRYLKGVAKVYLYSARILKDHGFCAHYFELAYELSEKIKDFEPLLHLQVQYHLGVFYLDKVEKKIDQLQCLSVRPKDLEKDLHDPEEDRLYVKEYGAELLIQNWNAQKLDKTTYNYSEALKRVEKFVDAELKNLGSKGVKALRRKNYAGRASIHKNARKELLGIAVSCFKSIRESNCMAGFKNLATDQLQRASRLLIKNDLIILN